MKLVKEDIKNERGTERVFGMRNNARSNFSSMDVTFSRTLTLTLQKTASNYV
ncbi:MAG: hypothetical protein V3U92_04570 [Cellulophaga sp.]